MFTFFIHNKECYKVFLLKSGQEEDDISKICAKKINLDKLLLHAFHIADKADQK